MPREGSVPDRSNRGPSPSDRSGPGRSPTTAGLPGTQGFTSLSDPGLGRQRAEEAERIAKQSFLSSITRGGFFGYLERGLGSFLGIDQQVALDPRTGQPGLRVDLNLASLASNFFGLQGIAATMSAARVLGPGAAAMMGTQTASQRQATKGNITDFTGMLGIPTGPHLGFAPLPGEAERARQRKARGQPLDAQSRFALDFEERQAAERAVRGQGKGQASDSDRLGGGNPSNFLLPINQRRNPNGQ